MTTKLASDLAAEWARSIGITSVHGALGWLDVKIERAPWPASKATTEQRLKEARSLADWHKARSVVLRDLVLYAPPEAAQAAAREMIEGGDPEGMLVKAWMAAQWQ